MFGSNPFDGGNPFGGGDPFGGANFEFEFDMPGGGGFGGHHDAFLGGFQDEFVTENPYRGGGARKDILDFMMRGGTGGTGSRRQVSASLATTLIA